MAAIKQGILTPSTKAELEKAEAEKTRLQEMLTEEPRLPKVLPNLSERYANLVARLEVALQRDIPKARTLISGLLGRDIRLYPNDEAYLEAHLVGDYRGLIGLVSEAPNNPNAPRQLSLVAGARNHLYRTRVLFG